ncbi:dimethylaniline monooxygenase [N-oxide-forming] [Elysia marginata]|uniref:Flavin-containing monooxygenase n=1 Tax=Elysia marginata TaxID=1093978 RepID=A0AAV4GFL5_9GAST|nr:dimethylaniline monooxygenase [N-oxide-forming] [Elysia marginata]
MNLYMMVLPLHRKHNTLAVVGHYASDGPMIVMGENQARLAVSVMAGIRTLPSLEVMSHSVQFWNKASSSRRSGCNKYFLPGFAFMDAIAIAGGFYPSFWKIFLRDPVLAWRTWNGPYFAAQYRLLGPGSQWSTAREVCHTAYEDGFSCAVNGKTNNNNNQHHKGSRGSKTKVFRVCLVMSGLVCVSLLGWRRVWAVCSQVRIRVS